MYVSTLNNNSACSEIITLPAAFAGEESLLGVQLWGTTTVGDTQICQSFLDCASVLTGRSDLQLPPNKTYNIYMLYIIYIYSLFIPSLFCCFSTLTGSSKAEKQNTYISVFKTHKKLTNTQHFTGFQWHVFFFFLFTRITENEEPQLNFNRLKSAGNNLRTRDPCLGSMESWYCRNTHVGEALEGL